MRQHLWMNVSREPSLDKLHMILLVRYLCQFDTHLHGVDLVLVCCLLYDIVSSLDYRGSWNNRAHSLPLFYHTLIAMTQKHQVLQVQLNFSKFAPAKMQHSKRMCKQQARCHAHICHMLSQMRT